MRLLRVWAILLLVMLGSQGHLFSLITSRIEGIVLDKASGEPVEGAYVILYRGIEYFYLEDPIKTDAKGHFKFPGLKALIRDKKYAVAIIKRGYAQVGPDHIVLERLLENGVPSNSVELPADYPGFFYMKQGQVKFLEIKLEKESVLEVSYYRKTHKGLEPLFASNTSGGLTARDSGALIRAHWNGNKDIYTGLSGDREYVLEVLPKGYPRFERTFYLAKGETKKTDVVMDFTVGQTLYGMISYRESGKPAWNVYISIDDGKGTHLRTYTDENGEFWLGGFEPGGYVISWYHGTSEKEAEAIVNVKASEIKRFDISL